MTSRKKGTKNWNASPAACLMPQLRANVATRRGHRSGKFYENESPGKLYTYVSAGNIEIYENFPSTYISTRNVSVWLPETR